MGFTARVRRECATEDGSGRAGRHHQHRLLLAPSRPETAVHAGHDNGGRSFRHRDLLDAARWTLTMSRPAPIWPAWGPIPSESRRWRPRSCPAPGSSPTTPRNPSRWARRSLPWPGGFWTRRGTGPWEFGPEGRRRRPPSSPRTGVSYQGAVIKVGLAALVHSVSRGLRREVRGRPAPRRRCARGMCERGR